MRISTFAVICGLVLVLAFVTESHGVSITNISPSQRAELANYRQKVSEGDFRAYIEICRIMLDVGLHAQAAGACEQGISLLENDESWARDPESVAKAHKLYGESLRETGRYTQAARSYVIAFKNGDTFAASGLALSLTWTGRHEQASKIIAAAAKRMNTESKVVDLFSPWIALLFGFSPRDCLRVARSNSDASILHAATIWNQTYPGRPMRAATIWNQTYPGRSMRAAKTSYPLSPMKVAYISADFGGFSPVGQDMKHAFAMHNSHNVVPTLYALNPEDASPLRAEIRQKAPRFVDVSGEGSVQMAERIARDDTIILVEMNGFTAGNRLEILAYRAAPIQIAFKGFMGTMGHKEVDYAVVDRAAVPPHLAWSVDEKLIMMPNSLFVCDLKQDSMHVVHEPYPRSLRSKYGLPEDAFIFACFNRLFKMDAQTYSLWLRILEAMPNSVLWLLRFPREAEEVMRAQAIEYGLEEGRVVFTELFPAKEHLQVKGLADLFLDTLRFNAHGTAAESLWAGVPVLTLPGVLMSQRVAVGVVEAALPAPYDQYRRYLIAKSVDDYFEKAVRLATDPILMNAVKTAVRDARLEAPLFDTIRYMHTLEIAYAMTVDIWRSGQPPRHIVLQRKEN